MTHSRTAWRWAVGGFAAGAIALTIVAATDEPGVGETPGAVTVTLDAFDGSAPEPTVTVEPATDLVDHQVVTVHGEGFDPAGSATLWQCFEEGGGCGTDFTEIDDGGGFTRTVGISASGGSVDCREAPATCTLTVEVYEQGAGENRTVGAVPLEFERDAPLATEPTIRVLVDEGLSDGDVVRILGTDFRPGTALSTALCDSPEFLQGACLMPGGFAGYEADEDGRIDLPYRATALIETQGETLDCREVDCFLFVGDEGLSGDVTTVPLRFVPDRRLAPPPEAFARVVEGQDIRVRGEGFVPTEEVYVMTCIRRDGPADCQVPTSVHTSADQDGDIDLTFTPEPFAGFAGLEECREGTCFVKVYGTAPPGDRTTVRARFALDP